VEVRDHIDVEIILEFATQIGAVVYIGEIDPSIYVKLPSRADVELLTLTQLRKRMRI
jgi:hypothetical protein